MFLYVLSTEKEIKYKYKINTVGGEIFESKDPKVFQYKVWQDPKLFQLKGLTFNFLYS